MTQPQTLKDYPDYQPCGPAIRLAINGRFLDEVKTLREQPGETEVGAYLSFPIEQHRTGFDGEATLLYLPVLTALQSTAIIREPCAERALEEGLFVSSARMMGISNGLSLR